MLVDAGARFGAELALSSYTRLLIVWVPTAALIIAVGAFIYSKAIKANRVLARRQMAEFSPKQRRLRKYLLASYPAFTVLAAGVGALADSGDRMGGAIAGFVIGMFGWLLASWTLALELARRKWVNRRRNS